MNYRSRKHGVFIKHLSRLKPVGAMEPLKTEQFIFKTSVVSIVFNEKKKVLIEYVGTIERQ